MPKVTAETIGTIYEKLCSGDPITDTELVEALPLFHKLETMLQSLGPHFHLAWVKIAEVTRLLEIAEEARQLKS